MSKGYDPSETRSTTIMPEWKGAIPIKGLEDATGADAILSGITDMPLRSMGLVAEHVLGGAQLIAIKRTGRGSDMLDSVGERLQSHLLKMQLFFREIGLPPEKWAAQSCLLVTGIHLYRSGECYFGEQRQGHNAPYAYLVGPHERTSYKAYETAKNDWIARGGSVLADCLTLAELPEYLDRQEQRLIGYKQQPIKIVLPAKQRIECDAPGLQRLQKPEKLFTWLAMQPGIGIGYAQTIIDYYIINHEENKLPPGLDGYDIIWHLVCPTSPHPKGWALGKARALAEFMAIAWDRRSLELLTKEESPIDSLANV